MGFIEKIENLFAAVAFAEVGEHNTAREIAGIASPQEATSPGFVRGFENAFVAAAFAEADCRDMALEILDPDNKKNFASNIGLKGVKFWHATVPFEESFMETVGLKGVRVKFGLVRL